MPLLPDRPIRMIGAACGRGAPDPGCAEGPQTLRAAGIVERLERLHSHVSWGGMLDCGAAGLTALEAVAELCPRLAEKTFSAVIAGELPLVLTGDHSCAVGTWSGIARAVRPKGSLGLLWVDAHLDSHTPQTSHSGAIHGMPLAALLGHGELSLTQCGGPGAKLLPQDVCIVGVRSFEAEEVRFLSELGVRVFYMEEIARRGLGPVLGDALELVQADTAAFGVSLDLDAIDPVDAPGVGTPAAYGIRADALTQALRGVGKLSRLAGLEISEYNPVRDPDGRTRKLVMSLIDELFAAEALDAAA